MGTPGKDSVPSTVPGARAAERGSHHILKPLLACEITYMYADQSIVKGPSKCKDKTQVFKAKHR